MKVPSDEIQNEAPVSQEPPPQKKLKVMLPQQEVSAQQKAEVFDCQKCNITFNDLKSFETHRTNHHQDVKTYSKQTPSILSKQTAENVNKDVGSTSGTATRKYKCGFCGTGMYNNI